MAKIKVTAHNWPQQIHTILHRLDDGDTVLVPHQQARTTLEQALRRDKPECLIFIEQAPSSVKNNHR
jgi:hypothetical protein